MKNKKRICEIVGLLSQGALYDKVRAIQHSGMSPPTFARIKNIPYYGLVDGISCPDECKYLHNVILCNNTDVIQEYIKENFPVRCEYIETKWQSQK